MKYLATLTILIAGCIVLTAQNAVISGGSETTGSGGNSSFTIGQTFANNVSNDNLEQTSGVQQSVEFTLAGQQLTINIVEHHTGLMLICENDSDQWVTYQWFKNEEPFDTKNYIFETQGLNGIYYLVTTDKDGNAHYSDRMAFTTPVANTRSLLIYPVPVEANELLHLRYTNTEENETKYEMQLYDLSGKKVRQVSVIINEEHTINTSGLPQGEYIIKVDGIDRKILIE